MVYAHVNVALHEALGRVDALVSTRHHRDDALYAPLNQPHLTHTRGWTCQAPRATTLAHICTQKEISRLPLRRSVSVTVLRHTAEPGKRWRPPKRKAASRVRMQGACFKPVERTAAMLKGTSRGTVLPLAVRGRIEEKSPAPAMQNTRDVQRCAHMCVLCAFVCVKGIKGAEWCGMVHPYTCTYTHTCARAVSIPSTLVCVSVVLW